MKQVFFTTLLCVLCPTILFAQKDANSPHKNANVFPNYDSMQRSHIGKTYPAFEITTLDGRKINQNSLIGKVTWLNFWFEDCPGCRNEFDKLNKLYDSLKNNPDFQFVAITYDRKETLPEFIKQFKLNFPIATVPSEAIAQTMNYGNGFPTNMIIDKHGKVALVRWWLTERPAKYGILMDDAYKMIAELSRQP